MKRVRGDETTINCNQPSVGRLKKFLNMKSPTTSNQSSFSLGGMKPASLALIATMLVVSLAALPGSRSAQAQGGAVAPQIEGSWHVIVSSPDIPVPFPSLMTFCAGGGVVVTDSSLPPSLGNVYHGTWARNGAHEITFKFLGFQYDAAGVLSGYIRVHETIRLERSGNTYNSISSALEFLDVDQNVVFGPFLATTHGTRINAE